MALAGGISLSVPQKSGYLYQEGILSPDGHCRAFDAEANGTVGGSGAGIVVLKRIADALADGDSISAIIKGSAINNDGSGKVGYTRPASRDKRRPSLLRPELRASRLIPSIMWRRTVPAPPWAILLKSRR